MWLKSAPVLWRCKNINWNAQLCHCIFQHIICSNKIPHKCLERWFCVSHHHVSYISNEVSTSIPTDIFCTHKQLVYPCLFNMIQQSDCEEIWLRLVYKSSRCSINYSCHKAILSVVLSLHLYHWQGMSSDTALYPALLLNIYTLVKHIKLTAGGHITAWQRSQIQYGSHSLPRICALNKERYGDRWTDKWV